MNNKLYILITSMLCFSLNAAAQTPNLISYQAVVRNASGALVSGKTVKARISILKDSANGTAVYTETHQVKTNANGLLSLQIGGGSIVSGNFNTIDWGKTNYFTKQEIDPDGGTNYTLSGVSQMLSVPYALHAKNAEKCFQHYVGELYGGGVVFHVWRDTAGIEHGLVVNNKWLGGDSTPWSDRYDTLSGAFSTFDGLANSLKIASTPGSKKSAAKVCLDLSENGFDDWYLPSIEELKKLFDNILTINKCSKDFNNFISLIPHINPGSSSYIQSSTELQDVSTVRVYSLWLDPYVLGSYPVYATQKEAFNFRAIRKF
jgi:hypothetical protein